MATQASLLGMGRPPVKLSPEGDKVKISVFLSSEEHAALKHAAIDDRTNLSELMADLARRFLEERKRRK